MRRLLVILLLSVLLGCAPIPAQDASPGSSSADSGPLNIYDEPLQDCGDPSQGLGSWQLGPDPYKCDELGGGVHQICFLEIGERANQFSTTTGQSDWSTGRAANNHCVCLGAFANYVAKREQGQIEGPDFREVTGERQVKCDAIPKVSLSPQYVSSWSTWNGEERKVSEQMQAGIEELYEQCMEGASREQRAALTANMCAFISQVGELQDSYLFVGC